MKDKIREIVELCIDEVYPDECPHCGKLIIPSDLDGYENRVEKATIGISKLILQGEIQAIKNQIKVTKHQADAINTMLYGGVKNGTKKT